MRAPWQSVETDEFIAQVRAATRANLIRLRSEIAASLVEIYGRLDFDEKVPRLGDEWRRRATGAKVIIEGRKNIVDAELEARALEGDR